LDPEHQRELEELKKNAVERFKYQKYLELTEQIKSQRDKRLLFLLKSELRALRFDPETRRGQEPEMGEGEMRSKARALLSLFEEKKSQLMVEDLEASLHCDVSRLNFLSFLKVFKMEVDLGDGDVNAKQISSEETEQLLSALCGEVKALCDQVIVLRSEKIVQVCLSELNSSLFLSFLPVRCEVELIS
jgi:hypothetical protein